MATKNAHALVWLSVATGGVLFAACGSSDAHRVQRAGGAGGDDDAAGAPQESGGSSSGRAGTSSGGNAGRGGAPGRAGAGGTDLPAGGAAGASESAGTGNAQGGVPSGEAGAGGSPDLGMAGSPSPSGPTLTISGGQSVAEGDNSDTAVELTITLSAAQASQVSVDYTTRDGTAKAFGLPWGYKYDAGTVVFGVGETEKKLPLSVVGDDYIESDANFFVDFSNPSPGITLDPNASSVELTILDDDPAFPAAYPQPALNDTGVTQCADVTSTGQACPVASYLGQDAQYGRDVTPPAKVGGGAAGFDFTKLDATGTPIANQADTYAQTPWSCLKDNVTGLVWEMKTASAGLHSADCLYSWWDGKTQVSGGGQGGVYAPCGNIRLDTYALVKAVRKEAFCGFNDWRLPTVEELRSISNYTAGTYGVGILDPSYFPNVKPYYHWTADYNPGFGAAFGFGGTYASTSIGGYTTHTRLVRGGTAAGGTRFSDNGDGTVTDSRTGLMWKRCSEGMSWDNVGKACTGAATSNGWQTSLTNAEAASFAGKTDWRLPNIKELGSVVDHTKLYDAPGSSKAAIDTALFAVPGGFNMIYWTSTPGHEPAATSTEVWRISLDDGTERYTGGGGYSLLVRTAP